MDPFPSATDRPRAVLVRKIPAGATEDLIDDFFSFCGVISAKQLSAVPGMPPTLEAVVVFEDEPSRRTALLMNQSSILDAPVDIAPIPDGYVSPAHSASLADAAPAPATAPAAGGWGMFGGLMGGFSEIQQTLAAEYAKALETDVVKAAVDQAALARRATVDMMQSVDDQFHVGQRAGEMATSTRNVAALVAQQSKAVASHVDNTFHIGEGARFVQSKVGENRAMAEGLQTVRDGFENFIETTGLTTSATLPQAGHASATAAGSDLPATDAPAAPAAPTASS
jgi:hypothetical protein